MPLADRLHAANGLPLRDSVDGIDVINACFAVVLPLMHGIDAQIPWLAFGIGLASLANGNLPALRGLYAHPLPAVHSAPAQVVDVRTEICDSRSYSGLPNTWCSRCRMRRTAQILVRGIGGG